MKLKKLSAYIWSANYWFIEFIILLGILAALAVIAFRGCSGSEGIAIGTANAVIRTNRRKNATLLDRFHGFKILTPPV